ncbi:MAG TPA: hypothetical protein VNO32_07155 [Candidatus Acidoferrum sp.]|nr:hypothetical protein [Candidatus Acidoferrum sp.]
MATRQPIDSDVALVRCLAFGSLLRTRAEPITRPQPAAESDTPLRAVTKAKKEDSAMRTAFDDKELSEWVMTLCEECSGRFLCALAEAVMKADAEDYSIIRPALANLKCKYSDANSDGERVAAVITDRRRAKRNSPSERRMEP